LASPVLWIAISVSSKDKLMPVDFLHSWLARPQGCPLSIRIGSYENAPHDLAPFLEAIALHSTRWAHLDLELSPSHFVYFTVAMRSLCTLKLRLLGQKIYPPTIVAFPAVPLLRTATLNQLAVCTAGDISTNSLSLPSVSSNSPKRSLILIPSKHCDH
jgi:hypothetical protein